MAFSPGARLGPYEVAALIGAGGMGEVYRATDTNLKRQVAIKVLPEELAADHDRLARFQREAEVLAALNHPHIAHIYGLERGNSMSALVMELVEGPTLADRIAKGAIPLDEALPIARQIAEALESAHEHGIIHRDLKPANIKVRPDGTVKILDFGLAKAFTADRVGPSMSGLTNSPTMTSPVGMTGAGIILGTAAYMAPEQAKGRVVDKRADIWAFGAVLYEMLTGRRAFGGEDVSDTLANVLKMEPDWTRLPASVPARARQVLRSCLQKDAHQRMADIQDVRLALDGAFETAPAAPSVIVSGRRKYAWAGVTLAAFVIGGVGGGLVFRGRGDAPPPRRTVRFEVTTPPGVAISGLPAISPDGTRLAFAGTSESRTLLWVRPLDTSVAQAMMGTEGASRPFWSADSQSIGFFAEGKLKTIAAGGGPVVNVCNLPSTATYNGTWNQDGVILFAANDVGPVFRVSSSGGQPTPATKLDASVNETRHSYPAFLPDGRHFVFWVPGVRGIATGALDSDERHAIPGVTTEAKYSPTGHLLFLQNDFLVAQPFDLNRFQLSGDAINIAEQIGVGPLAAFSVSSRGDIVYISARSISSLAWLDGTGRETSRVGPQAEYRNPMLSRDGKSVAFERGTPSDIWIADLLSGNARRFASDPNPETAPVWSPDGNAIAYLVNERLGNDDFYVRPVGTDERPKKIGTISSTNTSQSMMDWSRKGDILFGSGLDLWTLSSAGNSQPIQLTATAFTEMQARFSPSGRWIAYTSNEFGQYEVYVQSFPKMDIKRGVSTAGGSLPRWSADGKQLYYVAPGALLMSVPITEQATSIDVGTPRSLFRTKLRQVVSIDPRILGQYDVSADGRFLMAVPDQESTPMSVILNWAPRPAR